MLCLLRPKANCCTCSKHHNKRFFIVNTITPRATDYSEWYIEIVRKTGLADYSSVKGCMVIKPYGFQIWEHMRDALDARFKATGHVNAYFPLFIPKSFLSKEAAHVDGFAKECAVVTHYRLKNADDGSGVIVDPDAKLEEELIVRPTSETIIWNTYRDWIQSYRDLPLLINQWANVVRWEMRTRLFLRTTEFLWQEGHTAHATEAEAIAEAEQMLEVYAQFAEEWMAMPVIRGIKSENERFAGAVETYCIEALMQDGKALQAGTSHFLGQNFAKAFDVQFSTDHNTLEYVWATSWGVSTRLMGALVMVHSDDSGLVLPPKLAPFQVVLVPIPKPTDELTPTIQEIAAELRSLGIRVKIDTDTVNRPGFKFAEYEQQGIPVRIGIGARDLAQGTVEVARRDTLSKESAPREGIAPYIQTLLGEIQANLYQRALQFQIQHTTNVDTWDEFVHTIDSVGGFVSAHWDGTAETETLIKQETQATLRCIPLGAPHESGKCVRTGNPSTKRVLFAKAY
jgi:prolyl-tRNA synthetase